jgi:hypothetical protein
MFVAKSGAPASTPQPSAHTHDQTFLVNSAPKEKLNHNAAEKYNSDLD